MTPRTLLVSFIAGFVFLGAGCGAARDVAVQQVDAIRAHDLDRAYTFVAAGAQQTLSRPVFDNLVETTPELKDNKSGSFNEISIVNNVGSVKGSITSESGSTAIVEYKLVDENGQWKVADILINGREPQPIVAQ